MNIPVITIDGPSGSGKGTIGNLLAKRLGWHFLDSGALYRVLAYLALQQGIQPDDISGLVKLSDQVDVTFEIAEDNVSHNVVVQNEDITHEIRTESCSQLTSIIATIPEVRRALFDKQRSFLKSPGLIADGRDMGSVIFPDAQVKIFLDASDEERALRRHNQLKAKGINVSLTQVLKELQERDQRDRQRSVAPLKAADDAIHVDTTNVSIDDVLRRIFLVIENRLGFVS